MSLGPGAAYRFLPVAVTRVVGKLLTGLGSVVLTVVIAVVVAYTGMIIQMYL